MLTEKDKQDFRNELLTGIKGGLQAFKQNADLSIDKEIKGILVAAEKFIDNKLNEYFNDYTQK